MPQARRTLRPFRMFSAADATISTAPIEVAVVDESTDTDLAALAAPEYAGNESDWLLAAVG